MTYLDEVPMAVIKAGIMCLICCKGLRRKKIKYNVGYKIPPWIMYPKTFARAYIPIAWNNDPTSLVSTMLPAITLAIPTGAVLYEIKLNSLSKSKVRKESVKSVRSIRPSVRPFNPSVQSVRVFNPSICKKNNNKRTHKISYHIIISTSFILAPQSDLQTFTNGFPSSLIIFKTTPNAMENIIKPIILVPPPFIIPPKSWVTSLTITFTAFGEELMGTIRLSSMNFAVSSTVMLSEVRFFASIR